VCERAKELLVCVRERKWMCVRQKESDCASEKGSD